MEELLKPGSFDRKKELKNRIGRQIEDRIHLDDGELREIIEKEVLEYGQEQFLPLKEKLSLCTSLFNAFRRLDILQELVDDKDVTEIMVNGKSDIFLERKGKVERWDREFESEEHLEDMIQQIVSRVNRIVNVSNPIVDARLEDGSRVHVVLPPVALNGAILTIRKFPEPITMEKLLEYGSITNEAAEFLKKLVRSGYNMFISGGTNSGKSTFLNALSSFIPKEERIITIEDSAELQIRQIPNLVRLETRNANGEGEGEVTVRDLIKASLRMNPDRIIVGEVRGAEAAEMLSAMNTGHDGSMSTGHANSPADMISRLETMVLMGTEIPITAVRSQISAAIDILIHLGRMRDRSRKVLEISEIGGCRNGEIWLNPLFKYQEEKGGLVQVGKPENTEKLKAAGYLV